MTEKASSKRRKFTATDRLLAHWKERRQGARRARRHRTVADTDRLVDPGFDEVEIDDLLADFRLGNTRRFDEGEG